jgi:ribosomal protein L37AE/L43A
VTEKPVCPKCGSSEHYTEYSEPPGYQCKACKHRWTGRATIRVLSAEEWERRKREREGR